MAALREGKLDRDAPVDDGRDEIGELSGVVADATTRLREARAAQERLIADAAHELRTPVTLIQGIIEAMIDGIYPLDAATLASVHEETVRLSRLIDTLRELEIIESGELVLELEDLDPLELANKALALFSSQASSRGIALSVLAPEGSLPELAADRLRLSEVLYNLLSNAIKYCPSGGLVRIRLWGEGAGEDPAAPTLAMAVEDSGPGIPEAERERVFERFYRVDRSRSQDSGGRGLGLAIASEIARAHGGSLSVGDSELGGAAFILRLPASSPPGPS
jgi:signal transduction histidine kinase